MAGAREEANTILEPMLPDDKEKIKEVIWLNKVQIYPNFGNMTLENLNPAGDFYALLSSICQLPVL